jgi:hypothetical protein
MVANNNYFSKNLTKMKKSTPKKTPLKESRTDQTDWKRIDAMKDEDIDFSDIPEVTPEMFARAVRRRNFKVIPRKKPRPSLKDGDVVE